MALKICSAFRTILGEAVLIVGMIPVEILAKKMSVLNGEVHRTQKFGKVIVESLPTEKRRVYLGSVDAQAFSQL